jgi:hypothetical protein
LYSRKTSRHRWFLLVWIRGIIVIHSIASADRGVIDYIGHSKPAAEQASCFRQSLNKQTQQLNCYGWCNHHPLKPHTHKSIKHDAPRFDFICPLGLCLDSVNSLRYREWTVCRCVCARVALRMFSSAALNSYYLTCWYASSSRDVCDQVGSLGGQRGSIRSPADWLAAEEECCAEVSLCIFFIVWFGLSNPSYHATDEVGAIVADVGTLNSRFGSAGQDSPRYIFRTVRIVLISWMTYWNLCGFLELWKRKIWSFCSLRHSSASY